jgi:hypothetical protein
MPKKILILSVVILCSMLLITCKKYPEGGYIKRGDKLIVGNWKLTLYEVNGIDSTELINYNGNDSYKKCNFLKHHPKDDYVVVDIDGQNSVGYFNNNNKYLRFSKQSSPCVNCISGYCFRTFLVPESELLVNWKILRLDKKELITSASLINNYKIKLKC